MQPTATQSRKKTRGKLRILARERGYQVNVCVLGGEGGAVAGGVRKVERGFDVWKGSAAGEHIVMYLLKFRPLCLIQYICTPFPSFPPAVHTHVYRNNKTRDHKFPHSLSPSASISLSVHVSPFLSLFPYPFPSALRTQTSPFLFLPFFSFCLFDDDTSRCYQLWRLPQIADLATAPCRRCHHKTWN